MGLNMWRDAKKEEQQHIPQHSTRTNLLLPRSPDIESDANLPLVNL